MKDVSQAVLSQNNIITFLLLLLTDKLYFEM